MVRIIGLDPGFEQSTVVVLDADLVVEQVHERSNGDLLEWLRHMNAEAVLVMEQIAGMGQAVGAEVMETAFWSGQFARVWLDKGEELHRLKRASVKAHICGASAGVHDSHIRQALIDRYGGKSCTRKGGALEKVTKHAWAALAVALTWADNNKLGLQWR